MEVASTSPDTGQQGGCSRAGSRDAQAPSGKTVRALCRCILLWLFDQLSRAYRLGRGLVRPFSFSSHTFTSPGSLALMPPPPRRLARTRA